jgi:hypothetical protein
VASSAWTTSRCRRSLGRKYKLNGAAGGTVALSGSNSAIHGFALRQGYILLSGSNGTARNNLVGMTATGSSADASSGAYGITFSAPNATVRGNFVTVNNSSIRSDGGASNSVVSFNEVARPSSGHTNTFDGILLINGASGTQITANLVRDQRGGGIELGFGAATDVYSNITVSNNTVSNNGFDSGTTPSTERLGMVSYNYTGSNVVYSPQQGDQQRRSGTRGAERERHDRDAEQFQRQRRAWPSISIPSRVIPTDSACRTA